MKYTTPASPVEAFRSLSSKISKKPTVNVNTDDSNHRLLDHSTWDQSDNQYDDEDILPVNMKGKFVSRKSTPLSPLSLKSPRNMRKALISRVNAAVENNSYFGHQDSRDDEPHQHLLARDGQVESRWTSSNNENYSVQKNHEIINTNDKPMLPDLVDLGGFSDSSESNESSNKENKGTTDQIASADEEERDGASGVASESLAYSVDSEDHVERHGGTSSVPGKSLAYSDDSEGGIERQEPLKDGGEEVVIGNSSTIHLDKTTEKQKEADAVTETIGTADVEPTFTQPTSIVAHDELMGSSSTVDFDDDLSLSEYQTPREEESEKKSIKSSPTDVNSYSSYTRHECPVVVSSSEHGDVILLSPKADETRITAEATLSVPSLEEENASQALACKFDAASVDHHPQNTAETGRKEEVEVADDSDDDRDDEFVISDDWSNEQDCDSVSNSSDPFGECLVNEDVVQNITEHRLEDNAILLGIDKKVEERIRSTESDSASNVAPTSEASYPLSDLEMNQLATKSSSSVDLASFSQIWEGSTSKQSEDSGSDSEECEESKSNLEDTMQMALVDLKQELNASESSDERSDSSRSNDKDSYVNLYSYWAREWNDLTSDDNHNASQVGDPHVSLSQEVVDSVSSGDEDVVTGDKYVTSVEEEEDSDEFYGCRIVEDSDNYSYDSYGLETISEEGEFDEDESAMPPPSDGTTKEDDEVLEEEVMPEEKVAEVEASKESISDTVVADGCVPLGATPSILVRQEAAVIVETVDEYSSDEEESPVVEPAATTPTVKPSVTETKTDGLNELWSKIDEYQASGANVEHVEQPARQTVSTKTIAPVKKSDHVNYKIVETKRASSENKKAVNDATFDDLSRFLDGDGESENDVPVVDVSDDTFDSNSNTSESIEDNLEIDQYKNRASIKRHVFTKLISPVSAFVKRRSRGSDCQKSPGGSLPESYSEESKDSKLEECNENNTNTEDDNEARKLAEMMTEEMMAREQACRDKAAMEAKQLAEIQEAAAIEQELAEIEGVVIEDPHYDLGGSLSADDESQIEIIGEEQVTPASPTTTEASTELAMENLTELWSKIDEFQKTGNLMDNTQVAMMAKMLNNEIDHYEAGLLEGGGSTSTVKSPTRRLRSSKHAVVPLKKRAVANARAKKTKYDLAYIETFSSDRKKKMAQAKAEEVNGIQEPAEESKNLIEEQSSHLAEPSASSQLDVETQQASFESDTPNLIGVPSATSLNSFASIISADKSSESLDGVASKDGSELSKGSLVSKLYSDNTDLAETLAATQYELEKAMKRLEKMTMERDQLVDTPTADPKSSFDEYFSPSTFEEEEDGNNENEWYGKGPDDDNLCEI